MKKAIEINDPTVDSRYKVELFIEPQDESDCLALSIVSVCGGWKWKGGGGGVGVGGERDRKVG